MSVCLFPSDTLTLLHKIIENVDTNRLDVYKRQVLPRADGTEVVVTFMDPPIITGNGNIRKVDADDPTTGLPGAVIKIEGVDNSFAVSYTHLDVYKRQV